MDEIDKEEFEKNLSLTKVYCEMQLANTDKSPAEILRSFNPDYNGKPIFSFGIGSHKQFSWHETIWSTDPAATKDIHRSLFDSQLAYKINAVLPINLSGLLLGRILASEIDETVLDGASEASSDGFIDKNDCPPIDSWIYLMRDEYGAILFSWVPEPFIQLAQNAIDVNCVDCIKWFTGNDYFMERNASHEKTRLHSRGRNVVSIPWRMIFPIIVLIIIILWLFLGR